MAKLEDYRERDKIRDAELALMKEKLSIVISSFEAEKAKIIAEYTLKFHENKTKLAEHEYPRIIEFVNDLPMTTTGKIIRKTLRDEIKE